MNISYTDIVRIMGPATLNLSHPMWQDVSVLNNLAMATIWIDEKPLWSGIVSTGSASHSVLRRMFPDAEVSFAELEAGIHY